MRRFILTEIDLKIIRAILREIEINHPCPNNTKRVNEINDLILSKEEE